MLNADLDLFPKSLGGLSFWKHGLARDASILLYSSIPDPQQHRGMTPPHLNFIYIKIAAQTTLQYLYDGNKTIARRVCRRVG